MYNTNNTVEHSFWNKNFVLLIISNMLLYVGVYMLFPVLHSWITVRWGNSDLETSFISALFGIGMFLPGALNSYLIVVCPSWHSVSLRRAGMDVMCIAYPSGCVVRHSTYGNW